MPTVPFPVPVEPISDTVLASIPAEIATLFATSPVLGLSVRMIIDSEGFGRWSLPIRVHHDDQGTPITITTYQEAMEIATPALLPALGALQFSLHPNALAAQPFADAWQRHDYLQDATSVVDVFFLPHGTAMRANPEHHDHKDTFRALQPYARAKAHDQDLLDACLEQAQDSACFPAFGVVCLPNPTSAHAKVQARQPLPALMRAWARLVHQEKPPRFAFSLHAWD